MEPNGTLEPALNGRFSLYHTPEGGIHIAWMADDDPETHHLEVPGFLANLAKRAAEGKLTPAQLMREVMANAQAGELPARQPDCARAAGSMGCDCRPMGGYVRMAS